MGSIPTRVKPKTIKFVSAAALLLALMSKNKDYLSECQRNITEWSHMSIYQLVLQLAITIKIQLSTLI
jgi:hypothetical protein